MVGDGDVVDVGWCINEVLDESIEGSSEGMGVGRIGGLSEGLYGGTSDGMLEGTSDGLSDGIVVEAS